MNEEELTVQKLIAIGANLGHKVVHRSMLPYVLKHSVNGCLMNMDKSVSMIRFLGGFIQDKIASGYNIVWVGDKKLNEVVLTNYKACKSSYLSRPWGGFCTNFSTVLKLITKYNHLLNDERLLKKNLEDNAIRSAAPFIQKNLLRIAEELKKYRKYDGLQNLNSVKKCIFIVCSVQRSSTLISEISKMNSILPIEQWSYVIGAADSNANVTNGIVEEHADAIESSDVDPLLYWIGNDDKSDAVKSVFDELRRYIISAQQKIVSKTK